MKITIHQLREMVKQQIEERCQKGYKTHPTRKTKKMFGRTYRNCVKAESIDNEEDIKERKLTKSEASQKEKLAKKYKPAMKSFKDQYGDEGESIYYATMTKKAKEGEKA